MIRKTTITTIIAISLVLSSCGSEIENVEKQLEVNTGSVKDSMKKQVNVEKSIPKNENRKTDGVENSGTMVITGAVLKKNGFKVSMKQSEDPKSGLNFNELDSKYVQIGGREFKSQKMKKSIFVPEGTMVGGEFAGDGTISSEWIIIKPKDSKKNPVMMDFENSTRVNFISFTGNVSDYGNYVRTTIERSGTYSDLKIIREDSDEQASFVEFSGKVAKNGSSDTRIISYAIMDDSKRLVSVLGVFNEPLGSDGKKTFYELAKSISSY